MSEKVYEVGQVVYLTSGSFPMVISERRANVYMCKWMCEDGVIADHYFPGACLTTNKKSEWSRV